MASERFMRHHYGASGYVPKLQREKSARKMFEQYCKEGVRPMMYDLTQTASGEYVSCFTEWAWKIYWKGINDSDGAY